MFYVFFFLFSDDTETSSSEATDIEETINESKKLRQKKPILARDATDVEKIVQRAQTSTIMRPVTHAPVYSATPPLPAMHSVPITQTVYSAPVQYYSNNDIIVHDGGTTPSYEDDDDMATNYEYIDPAAKTFQN